MESSPRYMKRLHSAAEFRRLLSDVINNLNDLRAARQSGVSKEFGERIMLAVTEVNGCRYCSYFHSKQALEAGLSPEEVKQLANGDLDDIPPAQLPAVLFAQHYAETVGKPETALVSKLFERYGQVDSRAILGYIRMIMIGNSYGNAFDAFRHRLKAKPVRESKLSHELGILLGVLVYLPANLLNRIFSGTRRKLIAP